MDIYRDKEDGQLTLGYPHMNYDDYDILSHREMLEEIDDAPSWDFIDSEIYRAFCDEFDLDYDSFDDPDEMFDCLKMAVGIEENKDSNNRSPYRIKNDYGSFKGFYYGKDQKIIEDYQKNGVPWCDIANMYSEYGHIDYKNATECLEEI